MSYLLNINVHFIEPNIVYRIQESVKGAMENHLKIEHSVKDDVIKVMINNIKDESTTEQQNIVRQILC